MRSPDDEQEDPMDPTDPQQSPQTTSPAGPRKPPPQMPKVSMGQLAALFVRDRDNEALDGVARTFAGRMHQIVLHIQIMGANIAALAKARKDDMEQIDSNFQQIGTLLQQLTGVDGSPADGVQTTPSPAQEQPAGEPAPPAAGAALPAVEAIPEPVALSSQPPKRARSNGAGGA